MAKVGVTKFHDPTDVPYGCFSVLSPHAVVVRYVQYPSAHHFFLCERFKGSAAEQEIRTATSLWEVDCIVKKAEQCGWQREDWDKLKTDVMLLGCHYKFKQNPDALALLLQTGTKTIVDHTANDSFWGDGGDGTGKNLLGVILMAVRKRLLSDEKIRSKRSGETKTAAPPQPPQPKKK